MRLARTFASFIGKKYSWTATAASSVSSRIFAVGAGHNMIGTRYDEDLPKQQCQSKSLLFSSSAAAAGVSNSNSNSNSLIGLNIDAAKDALRSADAVCFDVDSTVIAEEGIDVLAEYLGKHEIVASLTRAAMQGGMKFQDALSQRLDAMKPSRSQILSCIEHHPPTLTAGIVEVIAKLHARNTPVYLVSGGFRLMIEPIADRVGIAKDRVIANTILFNDQGHYIGFDTDEMTSRDMGKPAAVQYLIDTHGYRNVVMVGDGATDAQAKPPATAFIGFGGVVVRETVQNNADWFVTDFADVIKVLDE
jgi:phosphoserine phosphatase